MWHDSADCYMRTHRSEYVTWFSQVLHITLPSDYVMWFSRLLHENWPQWLCDVIHLNVTLELTPVIVWRDSANCYIRTHPCVDDLAEVNSYSAGSAVGVFLTLVNEHAQATGTYLVRSVSKYKQHCINDIWLATAIWTYNWCVSLEANRTSLYIENTIHTHDSPFLIGNSIINFFFYKIYVLKENLISQTEIPILIKIKKSKGLFYMTKNEL